jgi:hypothetical protein
MQMNQARLIVFMLTVPTVVAACNSIVNFAELARVNENLPAPKDGGDEEDISTMKDGGSPTDSATNTSDSSVTEPEPVVPPASTTCPASAPVTFPRFVEPIVPQPKPCKAGDLQSFLDNEQQAYDTQKASMIARNRACADCIYKKQSDPVWGPMTRTFDHRTFIGFGHCYSAAGASPACADAAHAVEWCIQKVCNVCSSGLSLAHCQDAAFAVGGTCGAQADVELAECNDFVNIIDVTCRTSREVVGVLCGGL